MKPDTPQIVLPTPPEAPPPPPVFGAPQTKKPQPKSTTPTYLGAQALQQSNQGFKTLLGT